MSKCTCPVSAWPAMPPAKGITFSPFKSYAGAKSFLFPCGKCLGCKLDRAQDWAIRSHHEAQMHEHSRFLTLTYGPDKVPADGSIAKRDLQLFMKRLRKERGECRYLACGEYGEGGNRPHYHMLVFGMEFPDMRMFKKSPSGEYLYVSPELERIWGLGFVKIGMVTKASAGYVARYTTKKMVGDAATAAYRRYNSETGEEWQVEPPFLLASTRPGIGYSWLMKYKDDLYPSGQVVIDGKPFPIPAFYKKMLSQDEQTYLKWQARLDAAEKSIPLERARLAAERHAQAHAEAQGLEPAAVRAATYRAWLRYRDETGDARMLTKHESQILKAQRLVRPLSGGDDA